MESFVGVISPSMAKVLGAIIFPSGILLIVFVGGDLFTSNVLSGLALFDKKLHVKEILPKLFTAWMGNFTGTIIVAFLSYFSGLNSSSYANLVIDMASHKLYLSPLEIISSGFLGNMIISFAIWASFASKDASGRFLLVFFLIFMFIISGFQHAVANMFLFSYATLLGAGFSYLEMLKALIMATIGNYLSGGLVFPLIYYYLYIKK
jgi:formate/nitrite transporter